MSKRITSFLVGALAVVLLGSTANAQLPTRQQIKQKAVTMKAHKGHRNVIADEFAAKYPLVAKYQSQVTARKAAPAQVGNMFRIGNKAVLPGTPKFRPVAQAPLLAPAAAEILVNCIYYPEYEADPENRFPQMVQISTGTGYSEVVAEPTNDYYGTATGVYGPNGGSLQEETYWNAYLEQYWYWYFPTLYKVNTEDWASEQYDLEEFSLMALYDCATAKDGSVYGVFYNADGSAIEWGKADYEAATRTTIATANILPLMLGITSDNVLYAIDGNGDLYKVDATTGEETLVGNTGLDVTYLSTGEIDQATNTFYVFPCDADGNTSLYTVNLEDATVAKIADYPGLEFVNAAILPPLADDNAPAAVENVNINFADGQLDGSASFTLPTTTFAGDPLTGILHWAVTIGDVVYVEGDDEAGKNINVTLNGVPEGMQKFIITASNAVGKGAPVKIKKWIGFDQPKAPTNVNFTIGEDSVATVTWDAPTEGVHNGFLGHLSYNVYRKQAGVIMQVAELQTPTIFTEKINVTEASSIYYYVQAVNYNNATNTAYALAQNEGGFTQSNNIVFGGAFELDKCFAFWDEADTDLFKIENANADGSTWAFDGNYAVYSYDWDNAADDWLIAPAVKVKAGEIYLVHIAASGYRTSSYSERLEIKAGYGQTAADMTITALEPTDITADYYNYDWQMLEGEFFATEDGDLNVGIHAISDANQYYLRIGYLCVEKGPALTNPAAPVVTAVPAEKGGLSATVTVKAPATKINGEPYEGTIDHIDLLRDDAVVYTWTNVTPGTDLVVEDAVPASGFYTYQAIPYENAVDRGLKSNKATVFIGVDQPDLVEEVNVTDEVEYGRIKVDWTKVSNVGVNGGYVDADNAWYYIYLNEGNGWYLHDSIQGRTRIFTPYDTTVGDQRLLTVGVSTDNQYVMYDNLVVGKPYEVPFLESGELEHFTLVDASGDDVNFEQYTSESYDENGYSIAMTADNPGAFAAYETGKISLLGTEKPVLFFNYMVSNDAEPIKVYVETMDGYKQVLQKNETSGLTELVDYATFEVEETDEWQEASIDLSNFTGWTYVRIRIEFPLEDDGDYAILDNVNVFDLLEDNLTLLNLKAPETIKLGETAQITFDVENFGQNTAADYTVNVTVDGQTVFTETVADSIATLEKKSFTAQYPTNIFTEPGDKEIVVNVDFVDDNILDNTASEVITVKAPNAALASNLRATTVGNTTTVAWDAPAETTPEAYTESFEDQSVFPAFSIGGITAEQPYGAIGEWTMYDGNGTTVGGFSAYQWENYNAPHAFQVLNAPAIGDDFAGYYPANTGDQYMATFFLMDGTACDKWLISPEQPGVAQTIKFMYRGISTNYPESFEVLASSTDNKVESFTLVQGFYDTSDVAWTEVSVDLPEGTRYFAIRYVAADMFGLYIDDVTYLAGAAEIVGYNVYVDGELVGNTAETTFNVMDINNGSHNVAVTVLYANGVESLPVSITVNEGVVTMPTAIDVIEAAGEAVDIYTIDGKLVRSKATNAEGLKAGVYVINRVKAVVK